MNIIKLQIRSKKIAMYFDGIINQYGYEGSRYNIDFLNQMSSNNMGFLTLKTKSWSQLVTIGQMGLKVWAKTKMIGGDMK